MAKKPEEKEGNKERWLLTYADLITLLMIFFVVMYALSQVDAAKFRALADALGVVFGGGKTLVGESGGTSSVPLPRPSSRAEAMLQEMRVSAEEELERQGVREGAEARVQERGLVITLENRLIFEPAHASISPRAHARLVALGQLLRETEGVIRVEGHTDNTPIRSAEFPSNWQLSALRAANIAQLLVEEAGLKPSQVSAVGLADSRPVADNGTPQGRARNRRVAIVVPRQ